MPIKILMPALSPTMTEGNLAKWLKKEGDIIKAGEIIAEIETDKATMEVEAVDEGILAKIMIKAGTDNIPVNSVMAILLEEGENKESISKFIQDLSNNKPQNDVINNSTFTSHSAPIINHPELDLPHSYSGAESSIKLRQESLSPIQEKDNSNKSRIFASPLAKRLAIEKGVGLEQVTGTGPHGRIIKADIMNFTTQEILSSTLLSRSNEEYRLEPNNNIRKIIAKRLLEAKQTIPHFYLSIECNVDRLLETRADINLDKVSKGSKISVNDFIILASAKALNEVQEVNASWAIENIKYYNNVDISVAVATDNGLITPIIKNADQKNIFKISSEMKELAQKARANKLMPDEFQGGGFSISNLGMFDITQFNAIINPPQSCILAIGASKANPVVIDNQIKIATIMNVTLSCDHRVVDGVLGARFLSIFKKYIEHPALMLI